MIDASALVAVDHLIAVRPFRRNAIRWGGAYRPNEAGGGG
jgi:hypothetical protein